MKKIIILILCCGVLISMIGCGGNTAPLPTESPPIPVSKTIITEPTTKTAPPTAAVEPTEKEKEAVSIESQEQADEPTSTALMTTKKSTEEITPSETTNTSEEKIISQVVETVTNATSQHTESETIVTEPTNEIAPESETPQHEFDINYWITFAKEYAVGVGLVLESQAVSCWDHPIGANSQCIYLERDIKSRLKRYANTEDITDVWIWTEPAGNDC